MVVEKGRNWYIGCYTRSPPEYQGRFSQRGTDEREYGRLRHGRHLLLVLLLLAVVDHLLLLQRWFSRSSAVFLNDQTRMMTMNVTAMMKS